MIQLFKRQTGTQHNIDSVGTYIRFRIRLVSYLTLLSRRSGCDFKNWIFNPVLLIGIFGY